ncbi:17048_t:CDS:2, partial [Gigaspora margarita]
IAISELPKPNIDSSSKVQMLSQKVSKHSSKKTPKKRDLDDPYLQDEDISKSTKYNYNDCVRTFWKSNTIRTDCSENLSSNNTKTSNKMPNNREINSKSMQNKLSASSTDDNSYIQDFNSSSNIYQVTTFVCAVLRQVIPEEFWGCNDNQKVIFE